MVPVALPSFTYSFQQKGDTIYFNSLRKKSVNNLFTSKGSYTPLQGPFHAIKDTLDHWLIERYCLFSTNGCDVFCGEIHHSLWPLQKVKVEFKGHTLFESLGIQLPKVEPFSHYSKGVNTFIWNIKKLSSVFP